MGRPKKTRDGQIQFGEWLALQLRPVTRATDAVASMLRAQHRDNCAAIDVMPGPDEKRGTPGPDASQRAEAKRSQRGCAPRFWVVIDETEGGAGAQDVTYRGLLDAYDWLYELPRQSVAELDDLSSALLLTRAVPGAQLNWRPPRVSRQSDAREDGAEILDAMHLVLGAIKRTQRLKMKWTPGRKSMQRAIQDFKWVSFLTDWRKLARDEDVADRRFRGLLGVAQHLMEELETVQRSAVREVATSLSSLAEALDVACAQLKRENSAEMRNPEFGVLLNRLEQISADLANGADTARRFLPSFFDMVSAEPVAPKAWLAGAALMLKDASYSHSEIAKLLLRDGDWRSTLVEWLDGISDSTKKSYRTRFVPTASPGSTAENKTLLAKHA